MERINRDETTPKNLLETQVTRRRLLRTSAVIGLSLPVIGTLLAACAEDDADDGAPVVDPDDTDATDDEDVTDDATDDDEPDSDPGEATGGSITIAVPLDAISLDPYEVSLPQTRQIYNSLYNTILWRNFDSELEPALAEAWEVNEDGTSWIFTIRDGVMFHSGNVCDAAAIKAYYDRQANPDAPGASASTFRPISDIEATDDEVIITTEVPNATIPAALSAPPLCVSDTARAEEIGDEFGSNPSGTGAFQFKEWRPQEFVTFERFDDYWGEPARLDEITFRVIPEDSTRVLAFERGEVDIVYALPGEAQDRVAEQPDAEIVSDVSLRTVYMGVNRLHEPFDDQIVRTALGHTVDTDAIAEFVLQGIGVPAVGFVAPGTWGYHDVGLWEHDLDLADELLNEAGWERNSDGVYERDGQEFEFELWVSPEDPMNPQIAETLQSQWQQFGFNVGIQTFETAVFGDALSAMDHNTYIFGSTPGTGDIDHQMNLNFYNFGEDPPPNRNYTGMNDERINSLTEEGRAESDDERRLEIYREAQEILKEEVPWIPIYHTNQLAAIKTFVQNFRLYPALSLHFEEVWVDES